MKRVGHGSKVELITIMMVTFFAVACSTPAADHDPAHGRLAGVTLGDTISVVLAIHGEPSEQAGTSSGPSFTYLYADRGLTIVFDRETKAAIRIALVGDTGASFPGAANVIPAASMPGLEILATALEKRTAGPITRLDFAACRAEVILTPDERRLRFIALNVIVSAPDALVVQPPPPVPEPPATTGAFRDVTSEYLAETLAAQNLIAADLDGDGDEDLIAWARNSVDPCLLRNTGEGFIREPGPLLPDGAGVSNAFMALVLGDIDNDGDLDVFAASGRLGMGTPQADRLFLNNGQGRFRNVSTTHLPEAVTCAVGATLFDMDGDDDLDLYIACGATYPDVREQDRLYENTGRGRFREVTAKNLPAERDRSFDVAAADVTGDGRPDLIVTRRYDPNKILVNRGDGRFIDESSERLPAGASNSSGFVLLIDVNRDGHLDIVEGIADHGSAPANAAQQRLCLNDGRGRFRDVSASWMPSARLAASSGSAVGDLDRDGFPEIFMSDGNGQGRLVSASRERLEDVTEAWLGAHLAPFGVGAAFLDVDGDGRLDVAVASGAPEGIRIFLSPGRSGIAR